MTIVATMMNARGNCGAGVYQSKHRVLLDIMKTQALTTVLIDSKIPLFFCRGAGRSFSAYYNAKISMIGSPSSEND